jgi:hypothetical protein
MKKYRDQMFYKSFPLRRGKQRGMLYKTFLSLEGRGCPGGTVEGETPKEKKPGGANVKCLLLPTP